MILHDIEIKPGMILTEDTGDHWVAFPHKSGKMAFVSYRHSNWTKDLDNHNIVCIKDCPKGSSIADGDVLWRKARFSVETKDSIKTMTQEELTEYIKRCDDWFKVTVV